MNLPYCPRCGKPELKFSGNKFSCGCGFALYQNTAAAVAVLLTCQDEILFTVRNQEPKIGKLDLPGGFCDPEETAEFTCKREILEELGLVLEEEKFCYLGSQPNIYPYKGIVYNTLDLFYLYELHEKPEATLELEEISDIRWISLKVLGFEELAFDSQKKFLKAYLKNQ